MGSLAAPRFALWTGRRKLKSSADGFRTAKAVCRRLSKICARWVYSTLRATTALLLRLCETESKKKMWVMGIVRRERSAGAKLLQEKNFTNLIAAHEGLRRTEFAKHIEDLAVLKHMGVHR